MFWREPEHLREQIDDERKQQSVSGSLRVLLPATLLGVLPVANAFILDATLGEFPSIWLGFMLILEIALVFAVLLLRPNLRPRVRWNLPEIFGAGRVGAMSFVHAPCMAPPDPVPTSFSVDFPHQHLPVDCIYQTGSFPDDVGDLCIYDDRPVAASAWAIYGARALGVLPAQTMYPLAALMVAAQVKTVCSTSVEQLPRRPSSHATAAPAALRQPEAPDRTGHGIMEWMLARAPTWEALAEQMERAARKLVSMDRAGGGEANDG